MLCTAAAADGGGGTDSAQFRTVVTETHPVRIRFGLPLLP